MSSRVYKIGHEVTGIPDTEIIRLITNGAHYTFSILRFINKTSCGRDEIETKDKFQPINYGNANQQM